MFFVIPGAGTDLRLLHQLQRGENAAWSEVTRDYSPRLFAYLRQNVRASEDAEDLLSETLAAAVRSIVNFDGRATLSTYLYAIANRKVADYWRRAQHTTSLDSEDSPIDVISREPDLQEKMIFEEAMRSLPEASRQVLLLRYHVGLSVEEIAQSINRTYKGTESLLSRARSQLREAMLGVESHGTPA